MTQSGHTDTTAELREECVATLGKLCELMNAASAQGLRIEFTIGAGANGEQVIQRFELWQRLATQ